MSALKKIELGTDEFEVIRLCDLTGLSQEEAGRKLGVSRGTAQRLVKSARRKVAQALVEGNALVFGTKGER
jgi:RNA polymerase sigma factor (sigma-70 family)